jgi:hypothetical protein
VYKELVAWEGVGEDTEKSYSACLPKISQNASRKDIFNKNILLFMAYLYCTIN